jgi:hypothetical protein
VIADVAGGDIGISIALHMSMLPRN